MSSPPLPLLPLPLSPLLSYLPLNWLPLPSFLSSYLPLSWIPLPHSPWSPHRPSVPLCDHPPPSPGSEQPRAFRPLHILTVVFISPVVFHHVGFPPSLQGISLIDTPGVLSGEKQRLGRAYNFVDVCSWFASRSDMVLLLFDPFKLDISDEFRQVIDSMKDHHDKIRVVLNKANQVGNEELMRVYGATMWSLAKVLNSPEVCRVYTGSFADQQSLHPSHGSSSDSDSAQTPNPSGGALEAEDSGASGNKGIPSAGTVTSKTGPGSAGLNAGALGESFFAREQAELIRDLRSIPQRNRDRKISEFTKRVRAAKTHLILLHHLRGRIPWYRQSWGEEQMLQNLEFEFARIKSDVDIRIYGLAPGDFPDAAAFRETVLAGNSIRGFRAMSDREFKRKLAILDDVLQRELPHISSIQDV